ncbi:MAG: hypothetical protein K0R75_3644 [Paenibacillaceae bacterium]|nr:hypothetical protein [Paenibacillaceae bacterium]
MGRWMQTILILIGSAILTHAIPFSSFFRNLDTMIHEFGHALVTLLLSGQVLRMELHADHSGVTYSSMTSTWSAVPIALAGYISSALFAMLMFYLRSKRQQRLGLKLITAQFLLFAACFPDVGGSGVLVAYFDDARGGAAGGGGRRDRT